MLNNTLHAEPISKYSPSFSAPDVMERTIYKSRRGRLRRSPLWNAYGKHLPAAGLLQRRSLQWVLGFGTVFDGLRIVVFGLM